MKTIHLPFILVFIGVIALLGFVAMQEPNSAGAESVVVASDNANHAKSVSSSSPSAVRQDIQESEQDLNSDEEGVSAQVQLGQGDPIGISAGMDLDTSESPSYAYLTEEENVSDESDPYVYSSPLIEISPVESQSVSGQSSSNSSSISGSNTSGSSSGGSSSDGTSSDGSSGSSGGSSGGTSGSGSSGGASGGSGGSSSGGTDSSGDTGTATPTDGTSSGDTSSGSQDTSIPANGGALQGQTYYVSPTGSANGYGTINSPWDITSTLAGQRKVHPGDTVYLLEGVYKCPNRALDSMGYLISLKGTADKPIIVSASPNQHVLIDGGFTVSHVAEYMYLKNIEITVSENQYMTRTLTETGSYPLSYGRMWGGLTTSGGNYCKYINLVIHDCAQGISFWQDAIGCEIQGCIIYNNGWQAPDRGHGHAIYTQNNTGTKTIKNCIMTGGYGYTMHGYAMDSLTDKYVNNYTAINNITYNAHSFLFGCGNPSRNIQLVENLFYNLESVQLGYTAIFNYDCHVFDNYFIKAPLTIKNFQTVDKNRNTESLTVESSWAGRVKNVFIFENDYDAGRAHVAIYNWNGRSSVNVDPSSFLETGNKYCFLNPTDLYGASIKEGTYTSGEIAIPMSGPFAALVLLKSSDGSNPKTMLGNPLELDLSH